MLNCPAVGSHELVITVQGTEFYTIELKKGGQSLLSEFNVASYELPIEPGQVIEWYLANKEPTAMIYRVAWSNEEDPFNTTEYLVVNLVGSKEICAVAVVNTKTNKNANLKARDILSNEFKDAQQYPDGVMIRL